jgi:hypothetical protein
MWKRNFVFQADGPEPLDQTENELFHETDQALDSSGLNMEKYLSVWLQGEGDEETPTVYSNVYVRTATLDFEKRIGFLQPLQGRTHQIKMMLTPDQKAFLRNWLTKMYPSAWEEADDHFRNIFEDD